MVQISICRIRIIRTLQKLKKACKRYANDIVPIKIDDDLQDENSKLRSLISNNFGRRKNNPVKDRKAIATYVELKGYKHGEIGNGRKKTCQNGTSEKSIRDKIAKELKICQLRWN